MPSTPTPSCNARSHFVPAGAVTGIGSLPFTSATQAIRSVAEFSPHIPFWPQLLQLSAHESVIGQGLGILADLITPRSEGYGFEVKEGRIDSAVERLHRSSGELTSVNASCFDPFEKALSSGLFSSAMAVKGQIEGPITISAYLFYKNRPFLSDPTLFAATAFHVSQMICWQIDRLKVSGLPVLLFVDEPALCLQSHSTNAVSEERRLSALAATLNDARIRGGIAGLHCCAAQPVERMCQVEPDIISFDAHEGLELFFSNRNARDFTRNGGMVAYGLIPTWPSLRDLEPARLFTRWLKAASLAGDPQEFAQCALITATCGLGLLEEPSVGESFGLAHCVSKLIRDLADVSSAVSTLSTPEFRRPLER